MSRPKQLWVLAGGNGAGKSTFYSQLLEAKGLRFVNADRIALTMAPSAPAQASYAAARIAEQIRFELLEQEVSFCFETVFSHPSKIDFIAAAKGRGYEIILVFIHLDNPELNLARISQRIAEGGHDVPADKVQARLPRALAHVKQAAALADELYLLDNSSHDNPFRRIATLKDGEVTCFTSPLPEWAVQVLDEHL